MPIYQREIDYIEHPAFYNITVLNMLSKLDRSLHKYMFCMIYLLEYSQKDVSETLGLPETTITRQMKKIRKLLEPFRCKE